MSDSLTGHDVTRAARVMLPTYPILAATCGLTYLLAGPRLLDTPVLAVADAIIPLPWWGALFLAVAVALTVSLLWQSRTAYQICLSMFMGVLVVWAAVFGAAAIVGEASPTAFVWPGFAAVACWASIRSINSRETD